MSQLSSWMSSMSSLEEVPCDYGRPCTPSFFSESRPVSRGHIRHSIYAYSDTSLDGYLRGSVDSYGAIWKHAPDDTSQASTFASSSGDSFVEVVTAFGSRRLGRLLVGRQVRQRVSPTEAIPEACPSTWEDFTAFGSRRLGKLIVGRHWAVMRLARYKSGEATSDGSSTTRSTSSLPSLPASPRMTAGDTDRGARSEEPGAFHMKTASTFGVGVEPNFGGTFGTCKEHSSDVSGLMPGHLKAVGNERVLRCLVDVDSCSAFDKSESEGSESSTWVSARSCEDVMAEQLSRLTPCIPGTAMRSLPVLSPRDSMRPQLADSCEAK